MADTGLQILCCLLALGHLTAGYVKVDRNPTSISTGLTPDLTINCTFIDQPANYYSIVSFIMSWAVTNQVTGAFKELISINTFEPDLVKKTDNLDPNAEVFGHININDSAKTFLGLRFRFPSEPESGFYRCTAQVIDDFGHPYEESTTEEVTFAKPDLNEIAELVQILQIQILDQEDASVDLQRDFEKQFQDQNDIINSLQSELDELDRKRSELQNFIFDKSQNFSGSYYMISGLYVARIDLAEHVCAHNDGYLAEIDDLAEYQFIAAFLNTTRVEYVMVSGRDETHNGTWSFPRTGQPVSFFNWAFSEPDTDGNYCMYLSFYSGHWYMLDMNCDLTDTYSFLCEVPIV